LLVEAALEDETSKDHEKEPLNVLLTIDLTASVCTEALAKKSSMVMAYHPFIFRGLKSVTTKDPQQTSLLKLVKAGISVYCPHTAVDAAVGGVNDWLASALSNDKEVERYAVEKTTVPGHEDGGGMGRFVRLKEPVPVQELILRAKTALGLKHVQVAMAPKHQQGSLVETIAICAGSGGSLLRGVDADLHFTGEIGHHEALFLKESGTSAIICGHSNTERPFLQVFKSQLQKQLEKDHSGPVKVEVSETDEDPLQVY
jgi:dinuclear metal center YbgI/SA1388 family protein